MRSVPRVHPYLVSPSCGPVVGGSMGMSIGTAHPGASGTVGQGQMQVPDTDAWEGAGPHGGAVGMQSPLGLARRSKGRRGRYISG